MTDEEKQAAIQSAYEQAMALGTGTTKPTYQGTYDQQIADTYDKIANREKFSYDLQSDPLYLQMKDRYINQGKLAMKDTMGTAAGLTGGYGSSYSQAVGQQQYDAYLQNLSEQIPELWQNAYQVYQDEGTNLQNQYSMLRDLGDTEYSRYQSELANWQADQDTAYNKWTDAYNRVLNEENTAYNREQDAFSRQQTLYSNLYQLIGSTGYYPSDDELEAAGMSRGQADALIAAYQAAQAASSSGSGGGSGSGSSGTSTGNYTISAADLANAANSGASASDISEWLSGASNVYTNSAGGLGLSLSGSGNVTKNSNGTYTYSNANSSKAATAAINNALASLNKSSTSNSSNTSKSSTATKTTTANKSGTSKVQSSSTVKTGNSLVDWFHRLIG